MKYLRPAAARSLADLVRAHGNPPQLGGLTSALEASLHRHGLVELSGGLRDSRAFLEPAARRVPTFTAWIHVVNACNLACSYCYIPHLQKTVSGLDLDRRSFMSPETIRRSVSGLFQLCVERGFQRLHLKFAGGEPTLGLDLIRDACRYAVAESDRCGVAVGFRMLSNGVFDPAQALRLLSEFHFGLSISVDGDPERHDALRFLLPHTASPSKARSKVGRARQGTWQLIDRNIDTLLAAGVKPYLLCTVTPSNADYLQPFVEYCRSHEIGFRLSPLRDVASSSDPGIRHRITAALVRLYEWIGSEYPPNMPVERFARFAEWNTAVKKGISCGSCHNMLGVDHRGNVASCQMRFDKPIGSLASGISHLFSSMRSADESLFIVQPQRKTGDCRDCDWRYVCAGGCAEHARMVYGTTDHSSPWCSLYGTLLPTYLRAIGTQLKRAIDAQEPAAASWGGPTLGS